MDIQDYVNQITKEQRDKSFDKSNQLTLGQIIEQIEDCELIKSDEEQKTVCFDFGTAKPTTLDSWRGSYAELALGYKLTGYDDNDDHFGEMKVNDLLKLLKDAIGEEYTGWKGGEFIMSEDTPVWVDNPGNAGNTGIVAVVDDGWRLVIMTAYCEY